MKTDKKTKYIVAGLIALLFVVTIVHSAAILNMSKEPAKQTAQVALGNTCLQVTPRLDFADDTVYTGGSPSTDTAFYFYYDIKNTCTYNIYAINPGSWHTSGGGTASMPLQYATLQTITGVNNPQAQFVTTPVDNTYGTSLIHELFSCVTCGPLAQYTSSVASSGQLTAFMLQPNQIKTFTYAAFVKRSPTGYSNYLALYPTMIKWFKQTATTDNNITSAEVLTYNFGSNPLLRSSFVAAD